MPDAQNETAKTPSEPPANLRRLLEDFKDAIFVFERDLVDLFEPDWVMIPKSRYEELARRLAAANSKREEWSVTSVAIIGSLEDDYANLDASIDIRVDTPTGATIDLQLQQAECSECIDNEGKIPSLSREANGPFKLRVEKQGLFTLRMKLVVEIDRSPTGRRLQLALPNAPVKSVRLSSKEEIIPAREGESGLRYVIDAGKRTITPALRSDDSIDLTWRTTPDQQNNRFAAFSSAGVLIYRIDASTIETEARLTIDARSEAREWTFLAPLGETVRSVRAEQAGAALEVRTEQSDDQARKATRLRLRFAKPVSGQVQLRIVSERDLVEPVSASIGWFEMENADSQSGRILVSVGSNLLVKKEAEGTSLPKGTRRIPASQLDAETQRLQPARAYHYAIQPASIEVGLESAQPAVTASAESQALVGIDEAQVHTVFRFSIRLAHLERIPLKLPLESTYRITGAEFTTVESERIDNRTQTKEVVLSLAEPRTGELVIGLLTSQRLELDKPNLLKLPAPGGINDCPGTLEVIVNRNAWLKVDPIQTVELARQAPPTPGDTTASDYFRAGPGASRLYFRRQHGSPQLGFSLTRIPQRIEAAVIADVRQIPGGLEVSQSMSYRAEHEPLEQVALQIPQSLSNVSISGDSLLVVDRAVRAGTEIVPLRAQSDQCEIRVKYEYFPAEGTTPEFNLPLVLPANVAGGSFKASVWCDPGFVAVVGPPWEKDVVIGDRSPKSKANLAVAAQKPPDALKVRLEPTVAVAGLIVPRMLVEETVASNGMRKGKVRWFIAQRQADQASIRIPAGSVLSRVLVEGKPAATFASEPQIIRVSLPEREGSVALEVQYDAKATVAWGWDALTLEVPALVGNIAIDESRWLVETDSSRLLIPIPSHARAINDWSWRGYLRSPAVRESHNSALGWLGFPRTEEDWSATSPAGGRLWMFDGSAQSQLQLWYFAEPIWILAASGALLIGLFIVTRSAPDYGTRMALVGIVVCAALLLCYPSVILWLWLGAQWGVYLAAGIWLSQRIPRGDRRAFGVPSRGSRWLLWSWRAWLNEPQQRPSSTSNRKLGTAADSVK